MAAWQSVAIALAIGLLIGAERERSATPAPPAGVRTFALAALAGAVAHLIDPIALAAAVLAAAALMAATYARREAERDPGATSEVALVLTVLLGGLAVTGPALAAATGVATAVVLLAKEHMHRFVREKISETELVDALKFFVVAFIVLPLVPHASLGPYGVIDPRTIWLLVVAVTALGWVGYVAVRLLGPRRGLPAAGLAGGFVSGAATTGAMARLARDPRLYRSALAGALLASVATLVQLVLVTAVADRRVAGLLLPAAAMGAVVLIAEAGYLMLRPARNADSSEEDGTEEPSDEARNRAVAVAARTEERSDEERNWTRSERGAVWTEGSTDEGGSDEGSQRQEALAARASASERQRWGRRPFELMPALLLAGILTVMLVVAAFALDVLGTGGSVVAISVAGLADAHAGALTAATLAGQGTLDPSTAALAAMAAVGVNTVVKLVLAYVAGGQRVAATLAAYFAGPIAAVAIGLAVTLGLGN
jgi:uncharacterized membrane protein (DUF4010 family)